MFDHSFASGSPDAGFYIGQCHPCNAVITDVMSKGNALGYSGTNAGGNLVLTNSEWTDNIAGIVPNTLDSELLPPQRGVTIVNNWIHSNHNHSAPARKDTYPSFGNGVILAGGSDDEVAYNLVEDHPYTGIAITPNIDRNFWVPANDRVHDNTVGGSGVADLAMLAPASSGNCFSGNSYHTSLPPFVENFYGCSSVFTHIGGGDVTLMSFALGYFARSNMVFPSGDYRAGPTPPSQPNMPGPDDAAPAPAGPSTAVEPATYLAVARQLRELASADLGVKRAFPALPAQARPAVAGGEAAIRLKAPSSDYAFSFFLAVVGYLLPILFIAGLLLRISRRGTPAARVSLARTRVLIGLPVAYLAFLALVAFTGYTGYTG
jgi:hypothetical protein